MCSNITYTAISIRMCFSFQILANLLSEPNREKRQAPGYPSQKYFLQIWRPTDFKMCQILAYIFLIWISLFSYLFLFSYNTTPNNSFFCNIHHFCTSNQLIINAIFEFLLKLFLKNWSRHLVSYLEEIPFKPQVGSKTFAH